MANPPLTLSPLNVTARMVANRPESTSALLTQITDPYGVYCVLEVQVAPTKAIYHVFPVMPDSLTHVQRYLQTLTPTQGGVFVDEYGRAPSPVVLQGTFGMNPRLNVLTGLESLLKNGEQLGLIDIESISSSAGYGQNMPVTGYKLVKLLGEMVDLSHLPLPNGDLPRVRFYNFAFGAFYEVALNSFQATMSVDRNGLWYYRLDMTMLRRINNTSAIDSIPGLALAQEPTAASRRSLELSRRQMREMNLAGGFNLNVASRISRLLPESIRNLPRASEDTRRLLQNTFDAVERTRRTVDRITSSVNSLRGVDVVGYATGVLDRALGLTPGTLGSFVNTVRRLPEIVSTVESAIYSGTQRIPSEVARDLQDLRDAATLVLEQTTRYVDRNNDLVDQANTTPASSGQGAPTASELVAVMEYSEMALTVTETLDSLDVLAVMYGAESAADTTTSVVLSPAPLASSGPNTSTYIIRYGDTLQRIARATLNDENAWPQLAELLPESMDGVTPTQLLNAFVGVGIPIPASQPVSLPLVPYVWDRPTGVNALGKDLPDELRTYARSDGTFDLVVLPGYDTLLQGLIHRLHTAEGTILDDPSFGSQLPAILGQEFGVLNNAMNAAKVEECLRNEPRLAAVTNVGVSQQRDSLAIQFAAEARNAGSLGLVDLTVSRE